MNQEHAEPVRVDIWLWAARFFKTRRLCGEALDGGKIELDGVVCKPAKMVRVGDRMRLRRGDERFEVEVLGLSAKRGPASVAQTLYRETEVSIAARAALREQHRLVGTVAPVKRPEKHARRDLRRIKHGA